MLVAFRKVSSKSLPNIKILFLHLKNFEKQIRGYKKRKAPYHKAFHIRWAPLFDKIVRKAGLIHYGGGEGSRTPVRKWFHGTFSGRRRLFRAAWPPCSPPHRQAVTPARQVRVMMRGRVNSFPPHGRHINDALAGLWPLRLKTAAFS